MILFVNIYQQQDDESIWNFCRGKSISRLASCYCALDTVTTIRGICRLLYADVLLANMNRKPSDLRNVDDVEGAYKQQLSVYRT